MKSLHAGIYAMCFPDVPVSPQNQFPQNNTKPFTPLSSPPSPIPHPPFIQLPKVKPKVLPLTTPLSPPVVNLKTKSHVFVHSNISYWDFKDFKMVTQYMWVWLVRDSIPRAAWLWLECGWSGPHPRIPRCYELFNMRPWGLQMPWPKIILKVRAKYMESENPNKSAGKRKGLTFTNSLLRMKNCTKLD